VLAGNSFKLAYANPLSCCKQILKVEKLHCRNRLLQIADLIVGKRGLPRSGSARLLMLLTAGKSAISQTTYSTLVKRSGRISFLIRGEGKSFREQFALPTYNRVSFHFTYRYCKFTLGCWLEK
jgi:GTPase involved in cell partitioning and DNA repair